MPMPTAIGVCAEAKGTLLSFSSQFSASNKQIKMGFMGSV